MSSGELSNSEIYAFALYKLGGAGRFIDVEDIYVECWRLSPSRFGWRKYDYPNHEFAANSRRDFESAHADLIIKSSDGLGRQLSAEGIAWVRERLPDLERLERGQTRAPAARSPSQRLIAQLTRQKLVRDFLAGQVAPVEKVDAAELLNCAPDSAPSVWQQRLARVRSAAKESERSDLVSFLNGIELAHPDWFDGGNGR